MTVDLRSLIAKLNPATKGALEAAAGLCLSRTHYDVELEHYLLKLLDKSDGDFVAIAKHYELDRSRLAKDLAAGLDRLKSGNARTPSLSPTIVKAFTDGWTLGSLEFGATAVRTGHTILAIASSDELARQAREISRELTKIPAADLHRDFAKIVSTSAEDSGPAAASGSGAPQARGGGNGQSPNLDQFTVDLTEKARAGKVDPVLGRDKEVRQVVDILTRRRQNNPILVVIPEMY